jgi:hypothetical protein
MQKNKQHTSVSDRRGRCHILAVVVVASAEVAAAAIRHRRWRRRVFVRHRRHFIVFLLAIVCCGKHVFWYSIVASVCAFELPESVSSSLYSDVENDFDDVGRDRNEQYAIVPTTINNNTQNPTPATT